MVQRGRVRVESSPKRVRVVVAGEYVADSTGPLLVWEKPYFPTYYFPRADVSAGLVAEGAGRRSPALGEAAVFTVETGEARVEGGAYAYPDSPLEEIRDHVAFVWDRMDHWFEEDDEVYVHARDPHTRVDILAGSRRVRIEVDGVVLAESDRPTLLFETGLPVRTYLPKTDVRFDLLEPSPRVTECPYKGTAEYWSAVVNGTRHEDLVWSYPFPTLESARIAGLVCFYDERVDLYRDGVRQEPPASRFG